MSTIRIPTTQFIELEYPVASVGHRLLSGLIDLAVLVGYFILILFMFFGGNFPDGDSAMVVLAILQLPAMGYSLLCEVFAEGQTLGKRALNLKTIRLDGGSPSFGDFLIRWSLRLVDVWITGIGFMPGGVGLISIGVTKNGQRLGDLAAGTTVVRLKLVNTFDDTIFRDTDDDYQVRFPEISRLSDRDLSIVKDVMDHALRQKDQALLARLATRIKKVAHIETNMEDRAFLEQVFKDYNHLYSAKK